MAGFDWLRPIKRIKAVRELEQEAVSTSEYCVFCPVLDVRWKTDIFASDLGLKRTSESEKTVEPYLIFEIGPSFFTILQPWSHGWVWSLPRWNSYGWCLCRWN